MSEFVLFLMIVALGLALRRAFVRIDYLEREVRMAQPPVPQVVLPPESILPPKGGNYRVERSRPLRNLVAPAFRRKRQRRSQQGPSHPLPNLVVSAFGRKRLNPSRSRRESGHSGCSTSA